MAINVKVPRDLSRIKEKIAFGLTKRQVICFSFAALIGIPTFFLLKNLGMDISVPTFAMMAVMMPLFFIGMYERNGETLEVIMQHALEWKFKKNQETNTFERMYKNGICLVDGDFYSKTISFEDINYKLASEEERQHIFDNWRSFLNYFDTSVEFELTFANVYADMDELKELIRIKTVGDEFDALRDEYSDMLAENLGAINAVLVKKKYITFGIHAESMSDAKNRLALIEKKVLENFEQMGVRAKVLDGDERIAAIQKMAFNQLDILSKTKYPTKREFEVADYYGTVSCFSYDAPEMNDQFFERLINLETQQVFSIHLQSFNQNEAIKGVKRKITDIDANKIDEQKKAVRGGYDMDLIPNDLNIYGKDASSMLSNLQSQNERMFKMTALILSTGENKDKLKANLNEMNSIIQQYSCDMYQLDYIQDKGLKSVLPLAANLIRKDRQVTTSAVAILMPFITPELEKVDEESLYYGVNTISGNLIFVNRKNLKNPNGMVLGTPGSGKSFSAKREISNVILSTDDDIIISDPEQEYSPLVEQFGGQVIHISQNSNQFINPMDINANYSEGDDPVSLKADFILSLCELIIGGKEGLNPIEKTVIDRCIHTIYRNYFACPIPSNMPLLQDLYDELLKQSEPEARRVATALEIYVTGSLNVFNHRTNVNINNRVVCYDIKELGKQLKKIGMLVVHDQVWGRVTENRNLGKTTRYYMDEFHLLLKDEQTAAYSVEIYKRFRKWGGIPTALTQNVKDVLQSSEVSNIFENCEFIYMLNQGADDKRILAERLGISDSQLKYVTNVGSGIGLIFCGDVILPFKDKFPKNNSLYRIMTTKPEEIAEMRQGKGEL